ncbi:cytochrome P450 [Streptomyces sp. KhCrAH-43]|uniref:cytochrome P450 n=1 Tax=unclassified Streptomyces TaxID=2593676 RepID=UPI000476D8DB|nr:MULTISPECIES: cytochrome P450 [unclassified Streptomyces]RAJ57840.1 cytochrome P450 [Streptomyces sp. KhCrAH-43]
MTEEPRPGKCPVSHREPRVAHSRSLRFWLGPANIAVRLGQAGPVARTKVGPAVAFQINDPSLLRKVGSAEDTFQIWSTDLSLRDFAGKGFPGTEGRAHRDRRALMKPALAAARLTALGRSVRDSTDGLLAALPADHPVDISFEMSRLVAGLVVETVLNSHASPDMLAELARARPVLSAGVCWKYALSPWPWVPKPRQRAFRRALATLNDVAQEVYARHRPDADGNDVVSLLKHASDDRPEAALHDVRALLFAGIESTASTLAWACYELGRHPDHQAAIRAEADTVLGTPADTIRPDLMPRTVGFVREVTRLHGIPFLVRRTRHATHVGDQPVPAGVLVTLPLGALRRDPARYARPEEFDPLRWSPDARPPLSPAALLPYGVGPRYCPGAAAADILTPVALASLVRSRTLRTASTGRTIRVSLDLAPVPKGLTMVAAPREPYPPAPGEPHPEQAAPVRRP